MVRYLALWERDSKSRVFAPLAEAFRKNGQFDRAIEVCTHGLKIHPNYVSGRVALGRAYFDKGEYPAAKEQLEMVYEADPENLVAAKTLGEIYEAEGEIKKALLCYRLALYTTPSAVEIREKIDALQKALRSDIMLPRPDKNATAAKDEELSPLEVARKALRQSEATTAGDISGIDDREEEPATKDDLRAEIERLRRVPEHFLLERDELSTAIDDFFDGAGEARKRAAAQKHPSRKGELVDQSLTELMLRQGYTQRAVKVYDGFLDNDPDDEQGKNRVKELRRQLKEIENEIEIRQGRKKDDEGEKQEDGEILSSLTRWLNKVKEGV